MFIAYETLRPTINISCLLPYVPLQTRRLLHRGQCKRVICHPNPKMFPLPGSSCMSLADRYARRLLIDSLKSQWLVVVHVTYIIRPVSIFGTSSMEHNYPPTSITCSHFSDDDIQSRLIYSTIPSSWKETQSARNDILFPCITRNCIVARTTCLPPDPAQHLPRFPALSNRQREDAHVMMTAAAALLYRWFPSKSSSQNIELIDL